MFNLLLNNKYIYFYIFICLFNPTANAQEGIFSVTANGKTWKLTLDVSENAVVFYNKLKSDKTIDVELQVMKGANGMGKTTYFSARTDFGFVESTSDTPGYDRNYILIGYRNEGGESLVIVVKNDISMTQILQGHKIGELAEGMDKLAELDKLIEGMENRGKLTFTFVYEEESNKLISIIIGALLSLLILTLYLFLCLYL